MALTANYTVPAKNTPFGVGAIIGLNFYNAAGNLQFNAIVQAFQTSGPKSYTWNGQTNWGTTVSTDGCYWETLERPDVVRAEFIDRFISSYPEGPDEWMVGNGSHGPTAALACDDTRIFMRAGSSENIRNYLVTSLDGKTHIKSGWVLSNSPILAIGGWDIFKHLHNGIDYVWTLGHNRYLYFHEPLKTGPFNNGKDSAIGEWNQAGAWAGKRADVMLTGMSRTGNISPWKNTGGQDMHCDGNADVIAVTYKTQGVVRLYSPAGTDFTKQVTVKERQADGTYKDVVKTVYAGTTLPLLREFTGVLSPTGVCVDHLGRAHVVTEGKNIVRFETGTAAPVTVLSNQPGLWKIDQNHTTREWYAAFLAPLHQVKRYSETFVELRAYGKVGGRGDNGLYNKMDFWRLFDVCSHPQGGFVACESRGANRVVRFNDAGEHLWEYTGCAGWIPDFQIDPVNPELFWARHDVWTLCLWHRDAKTGVKTLLAIYPNQNMNGIVPWRWDETNRGNMGGFGSWKLKKHRGFTYLQMRETMMTLRFDHRTYELKPVNKYRIGRDSSEPTDQWIDANGNGLIDAGETTTYTGSEIKFCNNPSSERMGDFSYYRWVKGATAGGEIRKISHIGFNAQDAPIFAPFSQSQVVTNNIPRFNKDRAYFGKSPQMMGNDERSLWFFCLEQGTAAEGFGWNMADKGHIHIYALNPDGTATHKHQVCKWLPRPVGPMNKLPALPAPGTFYNFKNCVGVCYNIGIFTEFDGGYDGAYPAPTTAWDGDGFYIGGLFDNPDLTKAPLRDYHHNGDNGAGNVVPDYKTGDMFYAAGRENDGAFYRIKLRRSEWTKQRGS